MDLHSLCYNYHINSVYICPYFPGELANNNNGLGFNGYDKDGKAKWDLLNNCNIYDLEVSGRFSILINIENTVMCVSIGTS